MKVNVFNGDLARMVIATVVGVFFVVGFVEGSTTISTNITTDGTLAVTGASTLTGAVSASSTIMVTGAVTTYGAGTFGDAAGDFQIFNGSLNASSTALFTGALSTYGDATLGDAVADSVTANAYFTQLRIGTGSTFGNIGTVGADELGVEGDIEVDGTAYFDGTVRFAGLASSTTLKVGDDNVTTISGLVFGFCTIAATPVTASSSDYSACTGATGVTSSYRVFVQATSSIHSDFYITAASSTATAGTIQVRIHNSGNTGQSTTGINSFNFWAVR